MKNLFARRSLSWIYLEHCFENSAEIVGVVRGYFRIDAFEYSIIETLHIFGGKWWIEGNELVEDAPKRPNVRLIVIRLILPNLWTSIIRCTGLRLKNTSLCHFRYIKISQFDHAVLCQKYVGTFYISMNDFFVVKGL